MDLGLAGRSRERGESFDEAVESFLAEERPHLTLKRRGEPQAVAPVVAVCCARSGELRQRREPAGRRGLGRPRLTRRSCAQESSRR